MKYKFNLNNDKFLKQDRITTYTYVSLDFNLYS